MSGLMEILGIFYGNGNHFKVKEKLLHKIVMTLTPIGENPFCFYHLR